MLHTPIRKGALPHSGTRPRESPPKGPISGAATQSAKAGGRSHCDGRTPLLQYALNFAMSQIRVWELDGGGFVHRRKIRWTGRHAGNSGLGGYG
jgi:hypothetical protein